MKKAELFLATAIREQSGQTPAGAIASTLGRETKDDMRASLAGRGQMLFRVTKRMLCPMLVLFCVAFCAQNAHGQCTSLASGNWNDGTKWSCGHQPTSADGAITVVSGHTMTVTAAVTVDQVTVNAGGQITVNSGVTLTVNNGVGTDLAVNGTVSVDGAIATTGGVGTSFSVSGTMTIPGSVTMSQATSSFAVSSGGSVSVSGTLTINNTSPNLTISSGGSVSVAGLLSLSGGNPTLNVAGTLSVTGTGNVPLGSISDLQVSGTIDMSGSSTLQVNRGNGGSMGQINSGGNFILQGTSKLDLSGVATSTFSVLSGGTLDMGPSAIVNGSGFLTVASGANLKIGSAAGITTGATGNVQTTGNADSYATGANYTYDGTAAQVTGNAIPATVNNLTLDNSAGLTLSKSVTVNGVLALTTGDITTTASFIVSQTGTSSGNGDVVGDVNRTDVTAGGAAKMFGNPNVQIAQAALSTLNDITVNLVKSAPVDLTDAVKRTYKITKNGGTLTTATVRLHYLTSELNGNADDSFLYLWRNPSSWMAEGRTSGVAGSYVELTGVLAFSPWAIRQQNGPSDVAMVNLKATRYDNRVLLEWQTGYEVSNIGFTIYREENGKLTKVTPEPVAGSALIFGPRVALRAGFTYSWWDNDAKDGDNTRYWLEDLDLSGRTAMRGPFFVDRPLPGVKPPSFDRGTAPPLSAIGKDASALGFSAPVERRAKVVKPTAAGLAVQAGLASQRAVKLSVKHEGWYRVERADLVAAGVPADVDQRLLMLLADGQEVPIIVTGTGASPANDKKPGSAWDGIEFYGIGIDSAFTDSHVYWLVVGTNSGLRIIMNPGSGGAPAPSTFPYAVERRDKIVYFSSLKNGGGEKFFGPLVYNAQPVDQSVVLQHIGATGLATLDVSLQGFTNAPHSVRVVLNGTDLGIVLFSGLSKGTAQYIVPQSSLLEGSNQVQLISPAGFGDISMVEYVRVTYQHTNTADGNALKFTATGGQQTTIGGFTNSAVRAMDTTDANSPQELNVAVGPDGAGFSATFTAPGSGARTLLAFASDQKKPAAAIVANQPSSWRTPANAADYVAVTRKDLLNSLVPLLKQRVKQGLKTALVDIEDLYDEFSFGNKTPQALKDFFSYTKTNWKKAPRFALLAGDATYDPKNYLGVGDFDLVPTKLVETSFNETATDDWFVDVNGDSIPDIAIGRLPVRTAQETAALVSKIVGYDQSEATEGVVLVADRKDGYDFEAADTQLQALIPANLRVTDIRRGQIGDSNARSQLLDALNQGAKLVNFYGHGSIRLWTNAAILTVDDVPSLVNTERLALFDAMTCLNGFFQDTTVESLGEVLLKAEGGAIAVWASSGMTDPSAQVVMNQEAIRQLFSGAGLTIGEVTARAKAATGNADVRRTWVLLGDPATKIK